MNTSTPHPDSASDPSDDQAPKGSFSSSFSRPSTPSSGIPSSSDAGAQPHFSRFWEEGDWPYLDSSSSSSSGSTSDKNPTESLFFSYDADGNQSSTGEWLVRYNANNRPISFTQGNTRVECNYDYHPYGAQVWSKENIPNPIQEGGYLHLYEFDRLWRGAAFICEALSCSRGISTIEQQNTAVAEGKPLDNHLPTIQRAFTEFSLRYHASYTHNFILNSIYS